LASRRSSSTAHVYMYTLTDHDSSKKSTPPPSRRPRAHHHVHFFRRVVIGECVHIYAYTVRDRDAVGKALTDDWEIDCDCSFDRTNERARG
jgi:hypothetical protein